MKFLINLQLIKHWVIRHLPHKPAQNPKTHLYLHVGLHKTGTSAIQKFLRHNALWLQQQGFYYPPDLYGQDAHHGLPSSLRQSANLENLPQAQAWLENCHRHCQTNGLFLLLSSEVFSEPIRYDTLADLLRPFDLTVILYLRRQDLLMESVLNQIVKGRQDIRPDDIWMNFDPVYVVDFRKRIEHWQNVFPGSKMIVSRYESSSKPSLELKFLTLLQIDPGSLSGWKTEKVNPSLSLYEFIVLRNLAQKGFISSRTVLEQARINLAERIAKYKIADGPMVGNYFSCETRQRILEMYSASNEWVREKFFPNDAMLFPPLAENEQLKTDPAIVSMLEHEMITDFLKEQSQ